MTDSKPSQTPDLINLAATESPRQRLERHLDGSYQPGVLIDLLSHTLLAELDALNARLDGIEKRLPVIQEPRLCSHCALVDSPARNGPCRTCLLHTDRPSFCKKPPLWK